MVAEIERFGSPDLTPLDFCLAGSMKGEDLKRKKGVDTRDALLSRILDAAAHIKKLKTISDEQHSIFAHELQSALKLTLGV